MITNFHNFFTLGLSTKYITQWSLYAPNLKCITTLQCQILSTNIYRTNYRHEQV